MRKGIMALEAISFQGNKFFDELTRAIEALRGFGEKREGEHYWRSPEVLAIAKTIWRHTGLSFTLHDGEDSGPAVAFPQLDANSVLWSAVQKQSALHHAEVDRFADPRKVLQEMKVRRLEGTVDLKKGRVGGIYEKMPLLMMVPRSMLSNPAPYAADEVAAIVLHETGHAFTCMEFVSRTVSTNQALAGLVRALDDTVPEAVRTTIYAQGIELLRMDPAQQAALLNAKSSAEITCVVMDTAIQASVSELGASVYDSVTAEYLADQFVARCGAGRPLVTGLDKWNTVAWHAKRANGYWLIDCVGVVAGLALNTVTAGLPWMALVFMQDKDAVLYDTPKARYLRIKMQNIERLKNKAISAAEKKALIQANETIDQVCVFYTDNLSLIQKAAYYLRPSYRNAHKYELLQKDIEIIANNSLFTSAAKFSLLS